MIHILYTNTFVKRVRALDTKLQEEVFKTLEQFKNPANHKKLKAHKLYGKLSDKYAFSVNFKTRIIFEYFNKNQAIFMAIDNHDIYK